MNWVDNSHILVDENVTVGRSRIKLWLFADDFLLLEFSEQGLQHALNRF